MNALAVTITSEHLDRAIASREQPDWNYLNSCLLATTLSEAYPDKLINVGTVNGFIDENEFRIPRDTTNIINAFMMKDYESVRARLPHETHLTLNPTRFLTSEIF